MEDAHIALPDFDPERELGLFGVFDGHGGAPVAQTVAARLPGILRDLPDFKEGRFEEALYELFLKMDAYLDSEEGRREVGERQAACKDVGEGIEDADDEIPEEVLRELVESGDIDLDDDEDEEEEEEKDGDKEQLVEEMDEDAGDAAKEVADDEAEDPGGAANSAWCSGEGPDGMGTTSVVALVRGGSSPMIFCANAGDSRCVLVHGRKAIDLSRDHKPNDEDEFSRITKAGGFVSPDGRVDGNLNLSRALADFAYKKDKSLKPIEQKISCEAEVRRRELDSTDRYLLLGCDGIYEKVSSQQLVNFMLARMKRRRRHAAVTGSPTPLSSACSDFLDANIAVSPHKDQGLGCDNMSLIIVDLHADAPETAALKGCRAGTSRRGRLGIRRGSKVKESRSQIGFRRHRLSRLTARAARSAGRAEPHPAHAVQPEVTSQLIAFSSVTQTSNGAQTQ